MIRFFALLGGSKYASHAVAHFGVLGTPSSLLWSTPRLLRSRAVTYAWRVLIACTPLQAAADPTRLPSPAPLPSCHIERCYCCCCCCCCCCCYYCYYSAALSSICKGTKHGYKKVAKFEVCTHRTIAVCDSGGMRVVQEVSSVEPTATLGCYTRTLGRRCIIIAMYVDTMSPDQYA